MRITVINGTEKHGVTYGLKEIFLDELRDQAEITEFYLPKDCPNFCIGCITCFHGDERGCRGKICGKRYQRQSFMVGCQRYQGMQL